MSEKDYTKFNCEWENKESITDETIKDLNDCRNKLYTLGLMGMKENGVGFGNISIRTKDKEFIISGTKTGGVEKATTKDYTLVDSYSFEKNYVHCVGEVKASSETLTHAAVYESSEKINAIIHVHNKEMWKKLLDTIPITDSSTTYGTPELAYDIKNILSKEENLNKSIFLLSNHFDEGVVIFAKDIQSAAEILLNQYNQLTQND